MVLLIESLHVGTAWWRGELSDPGPLEWLLLAVLPVLAWIWWRYLSIFRPGCESVHCRLPGEPTVKRSPPTDQQSGRAG